MIPVSRTGVVVNVHCPNLCMTELYKSATLEFSAHLEKTYPVYGRTPEEGSRCVLHGAFAGIECHGCDLDTCKIAEQISRYFLSLA